MQISVSNTSTNSQAAGGSPKAGAASIPIKHHIGSLNQSAVCTSYSQNRSYILCFRHPNLEGGAHTNPKNEHKDTCQIDGPLGNMFIINRSYVVDEEMGAVNVFCRFGGEQGMPDSHTFRLVNGRYRWIHTLSVNLTGKPIEIPEFEPED